MKLTNKLSLRLSLKQTIWIFSILFVLLISCLIFLFSFTNNTNVSAASANGDYRTATSGNWNGVTVWQKYNGSSWLATASAPASTNKVITIQAGHTITITASITV